MTLIGGLFCSNCGGEINSLWYRDCVECGVVWCNFCMRRNAFYCICDNIENPYKDKDVKMENYEKNYEEFWKMIVARDGVFDVEQAKKELYDYYNLIQNVNEIYSTLTNGRFSKVNTDPGFILDAVEEAHKENIKDSIEDLVDCYEDDGYISVEDIRSYFDVKEEK